MPSAYIIADVTVTDPQQYEQYKKLVHRRHRRRMAAEVWCAAARTKCWRATGTPAPGRAAKFPSIEAARRFYDSPEYAAPARRARARP
jgi:uncharacterized protein (DUF1330 family)